MFSDERVLILDRVGNILPTDFRTLFPMLSEQGNVTFFSLDVDLSFFCSICLIILGIEFIQSLLRFDPRRRPTAAEALGRFHCAESVFLCYDLK